jgi:hypothetical protein
MSLFLAESRSEVTLVYVPRNAHRRLEKQSLAKNPGMVKSETRTSRTNWEVRRSLRKRGQTQEKCSSEQKPVCLAVNGQV